MNQPTNRPRKILAVWATALSLAGALHAQPAGLWNFTSGDLAAEVGQPLTYAGSPAGTSFGTTTSFGIADIGGQPANVMKMDAAANNAGYRMPVTVGANGGGGFVNNYTLVVDVFYPADSAAVKRPLLETDLGLFGGGVEFDVSDAGEFRGLGNARGAVAADTWYRLGIVVQGSLNQVRLYINGVEQGSFNGTGLDGRLAINPSTETSAFAELFRDLGGATALAYVNSVQFRDAALTKGQMAALAGPSAAGVPAVIPDVPSFVERWVPAGAFARVSSGLGVVLNPGSSELSNFAMTLNSNPLTVGSATDGDGNIVVTATGAPALATLSDYTLVVTYTDSKDGSKSFTHDFYVPLMYEDFELLELGSPAEEPSLLGNALWDDNAYTHTPPPGWDVDRTGVPGYNNPPESNGMSEWIGWSFANKDFWVAADRQLRETFDRGQGTVAVADPDEWDDQPHPGSGVSTEERTAQGLWYDTFMTTQQINLAGASAGSVFLSFDSSWRPEYDSNYRQTGRLRYRYDGGEWETLFIWESLSSSPNFKPDATNERLNLPLNNPPGATTLQLEFGMYDAGNDWWWAIDNIVVDAGVLPPTITQPPQLTTATEGDNAQLSVTAAGESLNYQWFKGPAEAREVVPEATSSTLSFSPVTLADDGLYSVRVYNSGGEQFSTPVRLLVLERFGGQITDDLVLHLTFDGNLADSTDRGNDGTAVGNTPFGSGRIGQGVNFSTTTEGGRNYVTLGAPADLNFGTSTDFTVAFWAKYTQRSSDPAFLGNKDWDSGGNQGWVFAASGDGFKWNLGHREGFRPNEGVVQRRDSASALGAPLNTGEWHHIAATFSRTGVAVAYVNGVPVNTLDISGFTGSLDTPAFDRDGNPVQYAVNIGEDGTGSYNNTATGSPGFGDAMMDDLGIWRRALGETEITAIFQAGLEGMNLAEATIPEGVIAGQWDFDNGDLSATVGAPMTYFDGASGATSQQTEFGTTTTFGIPNIGGEVVNVMRFPKNTPAMGYLAQVGGPNGGDGATKKNVHTLIFDILYPAAANNTWRSFIQIDDLTNANDGDLFINSGNGIGISGNYPGTILPDVWHRVVFVVDQTAGVNQIRKYIDGTFVGAQNAGGFNGRFGLLDAVLFFADETNETESGYISSIQVRNEALTNLEVLALGGATAGKIPATIDVGGQSPLITSQPLGGFLSPGGAITLSVGAEGVIGGYRWYRNDVLISGATGPSLTLDNIFATEGGTYRVEVFNEDGFVSSAGVVIDVFDGNISDNLVLHLPFNGDANDATSRGNNGTLVGQPEVGGVLPTFVNHGQLLGSHALRIGAGQHVTLGQPADLQFGADTSFTISFWVKGPPGGFTGDPSFVGNKNWGSGSNPGFIFAGRGQGWKTNHRGAAAARQDANGPNGTVGLGVITDDQWHHLAAVYDRNGVASIFHDGELVATLPLAGHGSLDALDFNIGNDGTGRYGFANDLGARFVEMYFDDLGVWSRRLTTQEIAALYQGGLSGKSLTQVTGKSLGILLGSSQQLGTELRFEWRGQSGARLQRNTDLGNPLGWTDVAGTDGQEVITIPINPAINEYFRLLLPANP